MPEARLQDGVPVTAGWFVINARDAQWLHNDMRSLCRFGGHCVAIIEGEERELRELDFVHSPPGTQETDSPAQAYEGFFGETRPGPAPQGL